MQICTHPDDQPYRLLPNLFQGSATCVINLRRIVHFKRADGRPMTSINVLATGFHVYMLRYEVKSYVLPAHLWFFQVFRSQLSRSIWVAFGITQVDCTI